MRFLSISALFMAAFVLWGASLAYVICQEAPLAQRLEYMWTQDTKLLSAAKGMPEAWNQVKDIELHGGTDVAKIWLREIQVPLQVAPKGQYTLEVLLVDWSESEKIGAMIQYNLVDHKTGNMVWELGRTLILRDANHPYQKVRRWLMNWLRHESI